MTKIILRSYQQPFYDNIWKELYDKKVKRVCCFLPTGGGKSVIIGKLAEEMPGRTLILTHRIEILTQNSKWTEEASILTAKNNGLKFGSKIVIAMVQTLFARIKKYGIGYIGEIDNIILDEVQVLIFQKVFKQYQFKYLVGFTGTPVLNKKKYTTIDGIDFVEPYTLSEIFDSLIQGLDSQELIDIDFLVQDYNIVLDLPDFDKLQESDSSPDGYTKKSLNEVYLNTASLDILNKSYNRYCKGKKTLIFNCSTKINKFIYKDFKSKGLNVKMFDTVNDAEINPKTGNKYTRDEIIQWFNNERDAILINTNVFTTGFDVSDVEVIIVNRATKSLGLWIQMVGRGSRITDKILKDFFTVIDLGQNIHQHGRWSMKRNWTNWFYSSDKKRRNVTDMLDTWECKYCNSLNLKGDIKCQYCGKEKYAVESDSGNKKKLKDGELVQLEEMPLPKSKSIIEYAVNNKEGTNFAFKLLDRKIVDLFIHYNVSNQFYTNNKDRFNKRIFDIYRPVYFAIIRSDLQGSRRKLNTQVERVINKVEELYNH